MTKKVAAVDNKERQTSQIYKPDGSLLLEVPMWHCLHCGNTWEVKPSINPEAPAICWMCKHANFRDVPPQGVHDPNCPYCKERINQLLKKWGRLLKYASISNGESQDEKQLIPDNSGKQ